MLVNSKAQEEPLNNINEQQEQRRFWDLAESLQAL
jgi:hypothetical protein